MKVLLRRDQRDGLLGKVIFVLDVRAEVSEAELANIRKYKLGKEFLYARNSDAPTDPGWKGVGKMILFHALNLTLSVNDMISGKKIECKNILEMLATEQQIREAAINFGRVLEAASHFGGEEVLSVGAEEAVAA
jgi:hypothetical protein